MMATQLWEPTTVPRAPTDLVGPTVHRQLPLSAKQPGGPRVLELTETAYSTQQQVGRHSRSRRSSTKVGRGQPGVPPRWLPAPSATVRRTPTPCLSAS